MAGDMIRLQMALVFGALAMQQRMVSGCWQMTQWMMPGSAGTGAATIAAKGQAAPSARRKAVT